VISPNVLEAEELVGHEFNDDEDRLIAVGEMIEQGAREAIMTLEDGCIACMRTDGHPQRYRVTIPPREAVAGVGAGDAFLAGYVAARYSGKAPADCLAYGVACGAESTQHLGAGIVEARDVDRLLGEVEVQVLAAPAEVG
jgi:fructose-1-phosphate kinase PfkB-like protein